MNWFRRSSRSPSFRRFVGSESNKMSSDERGAALCEAFRSHWMQANEVITHQESEQLGEPTAEQITTVFRHLDQMMLLLLTEVNAQNDLSIGPVLDGLFTENILQRVSNWVTSCTGANAEHCRRLLLRLYEGLLNQSQYCLLVHKPILLPMLTLLEECARTTSQQPDIEELFVLLLNQICLKITEKENSPLLEFFFNPSTDEGPPKFLVFTFLIPYLYHEGNIGQLARDALLLLLSVSANVDSVGEFIAEHCNFCPVLATGLSALYSALPRRLVSRADDWHRITEDDIDSIAEIRSFYNALEFCNAVVQVGHKRVLERLLEFIYNGFLVNVLGAALHENSLEELIAATAYLELFFRTATEPALLRVLLKFILSEQYDAVVLLDTLVTRISSNSRLCIVSLALFETLLNLNSEDLMFELVLKYLVPCTHIMVSQANNLTEVDYYGKSAQRFLSLIPACCASSRTSGISSASSASSLTNEPSPDRGGAGIRQGPAPFDNKHGAPTNSSSNGTVVYEVEPEITMKSPEMTYLEYLKDARQVVSNCAVSCSCWRFPYDGKIPDPTLFRDDLPPSTSCSATPGRQTPVSEEEKAGANGEVGKDAMNEKLEKTQEGGKEAVNAEEIGKVAMNVKEAGNESTNAEEAGKEAARNGRNEKEAAGHDGNGNGNGVKKDTAGTATGMPGNPEPRQEQHQDGRQPTEGSGFKRQSSFRKSKTNRYYHARPGSGAVGGIETVPELDWNALGGDEEEDEEEEREDFDGSDENGEKPQGNHESATTSSSGYTPRHNTKNDPMTSSTMRTDYFKLAFDDESLYGVSDSQEESDIGGGGGQHYILRGWSQIEDTSTFMEVLNRVRTSRTVSHETMDDIRRYIDNVYDGILPLSSSESNNAGDEKTSEAAMAISKDSGVDMNDEQANRDEAVVAVIPCYFKSSFAAPNIGPFLSVLLHKLDNMLQNSLFMNLHLTGVLARLSCYPQVLITSFLLNYSLVFQPAVRSLHQVLTSLRYKVDNYACTVDNFETLFLRGRIFLLQRERRHEADQRRRHSRSDILRSSHTASRSSSHSIESSRRNELDDASAIIDPKQHLPWMKQKHGRLRSFTHLFRYNRGGSPSTRDPSSKNPSGQTGSNQYPVHRSYQYFRKVQNSDLTLDAMKTKNVVYCSIVLEEFLREMAAISQEHAVRIHHHL